MKVGITGASGHVGANLVRTLLEKGWEVRALVRGDVRALAGLDVEHVPGDVTQPGRLRDFCQGTELVFHLAGHITLNGRDAALARTINVDGTRNVARACLDAGVRRLVHFSSIHAFDDRPGDPIDEKRPPLGPSRPYYGQTKAAGERVVLETVEQGLDAVIVNPTGVLGPHDYKRSAMGRVLADMASGQMPAVPAAGFDWVDARDVSEGAVAAALKGRTGQRYILSGTWASLMELGRHVDAATGRRTRRIQVPLWTAWMGVPFAAVKSRWTGEAPNCTADSIRVLYAESHASSALAARELGFRARDLAQTVADAVDWQRAWEAAR